MAKNRAWLLLLIVCLVGLESAFVYKRFLRGILKSEIAQEKILLQKQAQLDEVQLVKSDQSFFQAQNDKLKAQIQAASVRIPASSEIPDLLDSISKNAQKNGLKVGQVSTQTVGPNGQLFEVKSSIEISGYFEQVMAFLYDIASLPRLVQIRAMSLSQDEEAFKSQPSLNAKISISTYYWQGANNATTQP